MQIDILGSCVSRDAFSLIKNKYRIDKYYARTSIMSIYSKRLDIKPNEIKLSSAFQRRMVFYDMSKRFRVNINNSKSDYLVIDFIDERLKKVKLEGSIVTCSREFINAKLGYKYNDLSEKDYKQKWMSKADIFIEQLRNFGVEKVILHKALWKYNYIDNENRVCEFENHDKIKKNNDILTYYYDYIEEKLQKDGLNIIGPIESMADEKHKWGLAPFHYEQHYYEKFIEELNEITK